VEDNMSTRTLAALLAVALVVGSVPRLAGAAPVLCRKKSGAILVRDPACRKKEAPLDLAQFGAVGPQGDKGDTGEKGDKGDKGDPGSVLFAHTQNAESLWPITSSPTVVAVIGDPALYSGSYWSPIVQPAASAYMGVTVQAHVQDVSGTGVTCALERRPDNGAWAQIAQTAVPGSEAFLNASFASFMAGTSWSFRLVCRTSGGSGTARGEIGVVAGVFG
jgi:hypothetical protein